MPPSTVGSHEKNADVDIWVNHLETGPPASMLFDLSDMTLEMGKRGEREGERERPPKKILLVFF